MKRVAGIYVITNQITKKQYVGQSLYLHRRKREHFESSSKKTDRHNSYLHSDILKYGPGAFTFEILEEIEDKELRLQRERYWIKKLNTVYPNGYNFGLGGNHCCKSKVTEAQLKNIVEDLKSGLSAKQIKAKYNISIQTVTDINVGRYHKIEGENYPLRKKPAVCYDTETHQIIERKCPICGKPLVWNSSSVCLECSYKQRELKIYGRCGEDLKQELSEFLSQNKNITWIGRYYGVSFHSIEKKLKKYHLSPPLV